MVARRGVASAAMAEMHEYIYDIEAKKLLPNTVRARIGDVRKEVRRHLHERSWSPHDIRQAVEAATKSGHLKRSAMPTDHVTRLVELGADPSAGSWTIGRKQNKEHMYTNDFLLISGVVAAEAIPSKEFWNVPKGFSSASDYHGTVGAMLLQRKQELFLNCNGYTWTSTDGADTFQSRITADMHGDFRMERIRISHDETIDPFGNRVHYRPALESDRELVAPSYGVEPTVLAAVLKYIDQEKIDVPCLRNGCQAIREFLASTKQKIGPFGDFGKERNIDAAKHIMWPFAFPMGHLEDNDFGWSIGAHYGGRYVFHLDEKRRLTCTFNDEQEKDDRMEQSHILHFTPDDMEHVIMGLFVQTQSGLGRSNAGQLVELLEYRFSPEFNSDMEEIRAQCKKK